MYVTYPNNDLANFEFVITPLWTILNIPRIYSLKVERGRLGNLSFFFSENTPITTYTNLTILLVSSVSHGIGLYFKMSEAKRLTNQQLYLKYLQSGLQEYQSLLCLFLRESIKVWLMMTIVVQITYNVS